MLYKTNIYKAYLKLSKFKKENPKKSTFSNVVFELHDFPGGYGELNAFIKEGGLRGYNYYAFDRFPIGINSYVNKGDCVIIRATDPVLLRRLIFELNEFAKSDGYEDITECFYTEDIEIRL